MHINMATKWTLFCFVLIVLQSRPNIARLPPSRESPNEDFLNFSVIDNPEVRQYAEEFNALCPHTTLCDVNVNINHSLLRKMYREFSKVPCCEECSCPSQNCMETHECCMDVLPRLLTTEEVRAVHEDPAECIFTQYRSYDVGKYNGLAYILITECSDTYKDKNVRNKCHQPYSEFSFVMDIPGYLPVTDNRTMNSYKNLFCGICNHVPRSELVFWDSGVVCKESLAQNETEKIRSLPDIEQFIAMDGRCNLVFKVPPNLKNRQPPIRTCNVYIDKCNVTGLWKQYDPVVESLCASYLSSYKDYKNIHCYLCNGYDRSTVEEFCDGSTPIWRPSSFVSLLDFNNLELSDKEEMLEPTGQHVCVEGEIYDAWTKECRHLYCPEFAILQDKKCYPVFDKGEYYVTIRLVPKEDKLDVSFFETLQDLIANDVTRRMSAIESATVELCEIKTFVKLNIEFETFLEHLQEEGFADISYIENVSYVAIKMLVTTRDVRDAVVSIKEITKVLYNEAVNMTEFETEFREVDFVLFDKQYTTKIAVENPLFDLHRIFEAYADPIDGKTILPVIPKINDVCQTSPLQYNLLPASLCPFMILNNYDYHVEKKRVFLKRVGIYLKKSDVVFSQNGSTITICSDSYFSSETEFNQKLSEDNPYTAEFIVSVICISISLLCLLIVFVTYCCFKALRTLPGLNNMALVLSLFFAQLFYLVGGAVEVKPAWICEAVGLLLHFCLLDSFFWMGLCTFHMMMVFVFISKRSGSENTRRTFIRYIVLTNLAAATLVCINIIVSVTSGRPGFGYGGQPCYVTDKHMIFYTVAIPLGVVIVSNFIMFFYVIIKVSRLPDVQKNTKHERRNIVIFAKLSTLTGLTWIFAYIYQWTEVKAFAYLFIVANGSQGLFIMFSFIINKPVWVMITKVLFKQKKNKMSSRTTSTLNTSVRSESVFV